MPELKLLCGRPHVRDVDFANTRFVVAKACGLDVDGRHLEEGELIPERALSDDVLRQIYDRPLCLIQTLEYARENELLVRLTPEQEEELKQASQPQQQLPPDLEAMSRKQLQHLCEELGIPSDGNKVQLRDRLAALVA